MSNFSLDTGSSQGDIISSLNYALANLGNQTGISTAANVLTANTATGVISSTYSNTAGYSTTHVVSYLYQYLDVAFANSATGGSGFTTVGPTLAQYYGLHNTTANTVSSNPVDYSWYQVAGGFGITRQLYFQTLGGRQVNFFIGSSAPDSTFSATVSNTPINLDNISASPTNQVIIASAYLLGNTQPATPSGGFYNFQTLTLTPPNQPVQWYSNIPNLTANTIAYISQAQFVGNLTSNVAPSTNWTVPAAFAEGFTGNTGANGQRGFVPMGYVVTATDPTSYTDAQYSTAFSSSRSNTTPPIGLGFPPIANDTAQFFWQASNPSQDVTVVRQYDGANWNTVVGSVISGNLFVTQSINASRLNANDIYAINVQSTSANIGNVASPGYWLQANTGSASFAGTVTIGNNLTVGNNAVIGGNLTIVGLVNGGTLNANTVGTTQLQYNSVSSNQLQNQAVTQLKIADQAIGNAQVQLNSLNASTAIAAGTVTNAQIQTATITTSLFQANAVTANVIAYGAVNGYNVAANTITGNLIAGNTITGNLIAQNTITGSLIAQNTITGNLVAQNTITGNLVAQNTLTGNLIAGNTITGNLIARNTITGNLVAQNTLTGNLIAVNTITGNLIAQNTITGNLIVPGTITGNLITANTIQGSSIVAGSITATQLAANAIVANTVVSSGATIDNYSSPGFWLNGTTGNARFGNALSVGNNLIVGSNAQIGGNLNVTGLITSGGLAVNTVGSGQIVDGSIVNSKIVTGGLNAATVLASQSLTNAQIALGTIQGSAIASSTITGSLIAGSTITGSLIASSTITGSLIATGTITGTNIQAGTITATNIQSGTITASQIASGTITATQIATNTITASQIAAGTITATQISASAGITAGQINGSGLSITNGSITSGSSPAISGSTMTGSGAVINSSGTFAIGNSSNNITYNGTNININGSSNVKITGQAVFNGISTGLPSLSGNPTIHPTMIVNGGLNSYSSGIAAYSNSTNAFNDVGMALFGYATGTVGFGVYGYADNGGIAGSFVAGATQPALTASAYNNGANPRTYYSVAQRTIGQTQMMLNSFPSNSPTAGVTLQVVDGSILFGSANIQQPPNSNLYFLAGDGTWPLISSAVSGVTSAAAGSGISISGTGAPNYTGAITITNSGVTSLSAGSGISLSGSTGAITISSSGGSGTVTSVSGTGSVNGLTLSGTVTTSGSLTLSGSISIAASQVTSGVFDPARITASSGTNGVLYCNGSGTISTEQIITTYASTQSGTATAAAFTMTFNGASSTSGLSLTTSGSGSTVTHTLSGSYTGTITSSQVTTALGYTPYNSGGATVLTTSNYNSYSPTLSGGGAYGNWSINVTGSAGSAGYASSAGSVPASGITGSINTNQIASGSWNPTYFLSGSGWTPVTVVNTLNGQSGAVTTAFAAVNSFGSPVGFTVSGSGTNSVTYTISNTSDETLKKNIQPIDKGLAFIRRLEPVTFNWNTEVMPSTCKMYGFRAQNVLAAADGEESSIVYTNDVGEFQGKLAVGTEGIVAALTRAVQEQADTIDQLLARLTALESLVNNNK